MDGVVRRAATTVREIYFNTDFGPFLKPIDKYRDMVRGKQFFVSHVMIVFGIGRDGDRAVLRKLVKSRGHRLWKMYRRGAAAWLVGYRKSCSQHLTVPSRMSGLDLRPAPFSIFRWYYLACRVPQLVDVFQGPFCGCPRFCILEPGSWVGRELMRDPDYVVSGLVRWRFLCGPQ
jgi:hypothetical protein